MANIRTILAINAAHLNIHIFLHSDCLQFVEYEGTLFIEKNVNPNGR